jgi:ABC-type polar amino acid transport system ATPase subunit
LRQLRADVGVVFQQYNLFPHLSVLENILLGMVQVRKQPRAQAQEEAMALLVRVGLDDRAGAYPQTLSGGQQQRIAMVRALAMKPRLLLLDEPTSALDPLMARDVWRVIEDVAQMGVTLVIVSHDWRFVTRIVDRVVLLSEGQVVADGTPEQLCHSASKHPLTLQFLEQLGLSPGDNFVA